MTTRTNHKQNTKTTSHTHHIIYSQGGAKPERASNESDSTKQAPGLVRGTGLTDGGRRHALRPALTARAWGSLRLASGAHPASLSRGHGTPAVCGRTPSEVARCHVDLCAGNPRC